MYRVRIERKARKKLARIPDPHYSNIKKAILDLSEDPRPRGYGKLRGRDAFRIRIGNYRVIYDISDKKLIVDVVTLGHRKDVYE